MPDLPYHVTQRGTNREPVFFSIGDRKLYFKLLKENLVQSDTRLLAYCLMTNHVHLVVVPGREDSLALLFQRLNGKYAQALNIRRGRCGHFWQARFHSCPMSERHLWIGLRYVEENPCRAGLVERPELYRWSSAATHMGLCPDRSSSLDMDFWERAGGAETWAEIYSADYAPQYTIAVQKCTYAGRPFGDEQFVSEMEQRFQRKWRRGRGDLVAEAPAVP